MAHVPVVKMPKWNTRLAPTRRRRGPVCEAGMCHVPVKRAGNEMIDACRHRVTQKKLGGGGGRLAFDVAKMCKFPPGNRTK